MTAFQNPELPSTDTTTRLMRDVFTRSVQPQRLQRDFSGVRSVASNPFRPQSESIGGGGFAAFAESNFMVAGIAALHTAVMDRITGFSEADAEFDATRTVEKIDPAHHLFTQEERWYLSRSNNRAQLRLRMDEIQAEQKRVAQMAELGTGEALLWGLAGAVTDPVSYVPILGQLSKGASVAKTYRVANTAIRSGMSRRQVARLLRSKEFGRGFVGAATEGVAIETALQSVLLASAVNKDQREEAFVPTVALTGAFSGIFGGAVRTGVSFGRTGRIARRARDLNRPGGNLPLELDERGLAATLEPGGGPRNRQGLPGARSRLEAKEAAKRSQTPVQRSLSQMVLRAGIADTPSEADVVARQMMSENLSWVSPLSRGGAVSEASEEAAKKSAYFREMAEAMNRPRQVIVPATARSVRNHPGLESLFKKIAPEDQPKLAGLFARSVNGMANFSDFARHALGRGSAQFLVDQGPIGLVFRASADDAPHGVRVEFKSGVEGADLPKGVLAQYEPKTDRITFDEDGIRSAFRKNKAEIAVRSKDGAIEKVAPRDVAESEDAFVDYVILHEIAHARLAGLKKLHKGRGARLKNEADANELAVKWRDMMREGGPEDDPSVMFMRMDNGEPSLNSAPQGKGQTPEDAMVTSYFADGVPAKIARKAVRFWRMVSKPARGATSPIASLRKLQRYWIDDVVYRTGEGPADGSAMSKRYGYHELPNLRIIGAAKKRHREISTEIEPDQVISQADFGRRVQRAMAQNGSDRIDDPYHADVEKYAREFMEQNKVTLQRGEGVAFEMDDMAVPVDPVTLQAEGYYRRLYRHSAVRSDGFVQMVMREAGVDEETAKGIQALILSGGTRKTGAIERLIEDRGAIQTRGEIMKGISYDALQPYLNDNAFEAQLNLARTVGGEIEFRISTLQAANEMGIKDMVEMQAVTDPGGKPLANNDGTPRLRPKIRWDKLKAHVDAEIVRFEESKGLVKDVSQVSAAYKAAWVSVDDLQVRYPDKARELARQVDEVVDLGMDAHALSNEAQFARDYMEEMAQIVQNTRDIPENPDSWMGARLPSLVKNASHTIMGVGLGISNLADFHRSVTEFGFRRVFGQEWTLWLRDAEAMTQRNKITEEIGLALEHVKGDIQRQLRNALEHTEAETPIERLAEQGASLMSRLNGMSQVTNTHQRAFSSGIQSYLIDNIPKMVDGTISEVDARKLQRLGITKASAKEINNAFQLGSLKKTPKGTKYLERWEGESFENFATAVRKGVYINQSVPNRPELYDFQVQGLSSMLFMYRNWTMAANNRLMSQAVSNPEAFMMSGLIASIGLGALVTMTRAVINNDYSTMPSNDPEQFFRMAFDNGGYMGLIGEINNVMSRSTAGQFDLNPVGTGGMRYYDGMTLMSAVAGPVWHYPQYVTKTGPDLMAPWNLDRYDIERTKGMIPFNQLFYIDAIFNRLQ